MSSGPDIILFGGTFDPPHAGHLDCIRLALEKFPAAEVLVLPASQPATAGIGEKSPNLPFETRLALCEMAFNQVSDCIKISPLEASLPTPNYTKNTVAAVKQTKPGCALGLMIGMDQFLSFANWRDPFAIMRDAHLVVVGRAGSDTESRSQFETTLAELLRKYSEATPQGDAKEVYFLAGKTSEASSTELRRLLRQGRSAPQGWLAPLVGSFISKNNLYSGEYKL